MAKSKKKGNKKQQPDKKTKSSKMSYEKYVEELEKLEVELVKLQGWIKHKGLKVVVIFEGRDAAGKGGVIKRHARLNLISHLLSMIPYQDLTPAPIKLPARQKAKGYKPPDLSQYKMVSVIYP